MAEWLDTLKFHAATQVAALGQPRHALVTSVDPIAHAVKVSIQPEGIESGWIPDASMAAAGLRIACPSEIGSQVLVVPVEGDSEHPVLVARVFDVSKAPPVSPATGTQVQPGEVGIFLENGNYIHIAKSGLHCSGNMTLNGSLHVSGDAVVNGISVMSHIHVDVQPGDGVSGPPQSSNG